MNWLYGKRGLDDQIRELLYHWGFKPNYWIWVEHGEKRRPNFDAGASSSSGVGVARNEVFESMENMISDGLGVNVPFDEPQYDDHDELPNEEAQRFYSLLRESNKPLFEGSPQSKLSMCVKLLSLKSMSNISEVGLDYVTEMMLEATPIKDNLPKSYYEDNEWEDEEEQAHWQAQQQAQEFYESEESEGGSF